MRRIMKTLNEADKKASAFHGGAFWERLGPTFPNHRPSVVAADVLDAWFDPPPALMEALIADLPFLLRVSPPTHAEGLERVIARHRNLPSEAVIASDASSSLIHLLMRHLVSASQGVHLLEPTYSEYRFVAEQIGAKIRTTILREETGFAWSVSEWLDEIYGAKPRVAVLVVPNNPTGTPLDLTGLYAELPPETTLIVDEAYIDYTDLVTSEKASSCHTNVIVIKTLSKAYGLSGARLGYAVMHPDRARAVRALLPPWSVSGPAQWLGCHLWEHLDYYRARHHETGVMRQGLVADLGRLPGRILADCANWVLWEHGALATNAELVPWLAARDVFVRDASLTASTLSNRTLRLAVRPQCEQERLLAVLRDGVQGNEH